MNKFLQGVGYSACFLLGYLAGEEGANVGAMAIIGGIIFSTIMMFTGGDSNAKVPK